MKLLFDHHRSPKLARRLNDLFPGSSHVWLLGMDQADDRDIWELARQQGYALITKDSDFGDLSALRGFPPKVIWLRLGNSTTQQIEDLVRRHHPAIEQFAEDPEAGILELA